MHSNRTINCFIQSDGCLHTYGLFAHFIDHSGNLLDACALATKAALKTALVPSIEVVVGDEPGKLEIQVNDDPFESKALPVDDVPVCVSLAKVGSWFVVDPTLEEEDCVSASLQVRHDP